MCKCVNKAPCCAQKKCQSQIFFHCLFLAMFGGKKNQRKRASPILGKSHNQPTLITLNETGRKLPTQFGTCILHQFRIIVLQVVISLAVIRVNKRKKRMFFEGQVVQVQAPLTNTIPYLKVMQSYEFHQYLQWFTGLPWIIDYWIIVLYNLNMIMFLIPSIHPPSSCWGHVLRGTMSHRRTVQSSEPEANRLFLVGILCFGRNTSPWPCPNLYLRNLWCWLLGILGGLHHHLGSVLLQILGGWAQASKLNFLIAQLKVLGRNRGRWPSSWATETWLEWLMAGFRISQRNGFVFLGGPWGGCMQ